MLHWLWDRAVPRSNQAPGSTDDVFKTGDLSINKSPTYKAVPFGKEMKKEFLFDPSWNNINHGSFGSFPRAIREKHREYQDRCESAPDLFIRYLYPQALDLSREAVAKLLKVPTSTCVFVPNATTGINTVLRNLVWNPDGKDEVLYFSTIYGACGKTIEYVSEASNRTMNGRQIPLVYPLEDEEVITHFKSAISTSKEAGKRPRAVVFDTISSAPGLRMPFESLLSICASSEILSIVDGAHGIGHIPLDLSALNPDFFISNLHKWLFVPRGCAVFYVPERNQALMRSPLPTSHGFVPKGPHTFANPLPANTKSEFVNNFEYVGTIDNTNYLVAAEAIKWRQEVCGGEEAIMSYIHNLAKEGGEVVARILGTQVLDNKTETLTQCAMVNVKLPLVIGEVGLQSSDVTKLAAWMESILITEYKTFIALPLDSQGQLWARLSGQIYLDLEDFETAGKTLKELCERVKKGEYLE